MLFWRSPSSKGFKYFVEQTDSDFLLTVLRGQFCEKKYGKKCYQEGDKVIKCCVLLVGIDAILRLVFEGRFALFGLGIVIPKFGFLAHTAKVVASEDQVIEEGNTKDLGGLE